MDTNCTNIKQLMGKYVGQQIGINFDDVKNYSEATLTNIGDDFFTILDTRKKIYYTYPINRILNIREREGGISLSGKFADTSYACLVSVYHLIVEKGEFISAPFMILP